MRNESNIADAFEICLKIASFLSVLAHVRYVILFHAKGIDKDITPIFFSTFEEVCNECCLESELQTCQ